MIRICIYNYDMGMFHRAWIQSVTPNELAELQKSEFRRIVILNGDDWYGEALSSVLPA